MMKNETKQDVFDDALMALEEFGEQGSSWEMAYDDQQWTLEQIKEYGFDDETVYKRIPVEG